MKKNLTPEEKKIYKNIIRHFNSNWKMMIYWLSDKAKEEHPDADTNIIASIEYDKINALIDILSASFGLNCRILFTAVLNTRFGV